MFGEVIYQLMPKANGFYVDVGANDGITYTETKNLEDVGWNGICIEAHPDLFARLQQNRKAICHNAIVYKDDLEHEFGFLDTVANGSGLLENMPQSHIDNGMRLYGVQPKTVRTTHLETILKFYNAPQHIDFLKIDTEGSDFVILQSLSYTEYIYSYIAIENAWNDMNVVIEYMRSKGYVNSPLYSQGDTLFVLQK